MQRVEAGEFAMHAEHAVEGEDRVFVGVGEEERPRGEERGEFRVVPAIGVHHEHAVAVAFHDAVDHMVVEIGDAGDGDGDLDAVVERGGIPRVSAATGAAGHADFGGVDLRARLEVVEGADAVPSLDAGGGVAAGIPPELAEAARAVVHAFELAELNRVDRETHVTVAREPFAVVLVTGLVAEARLAVLHGGVTAGVENRGGAGGEIFRDVEIRGHVEARQRLEVEVLDGELGVLDATGEGGLEIGLLRARREAEHFKEFLANLRAPVGPVAEGFDLGERRAREAFRLDAEILGEHAVGGVGRRRGRRRRGEGGRAGEGEQGNEGGETRGEAGSFHSGEISGARRAHWVSPSGCGRGGDRRGCRFSAATRRPSPTIRRARR